MAPEDAVVFGGAVALGLGLVEVIKHLASKVNGGKASPFCRISGEDRGRLIRLDELHAPRDADGIPLWYLPRSWGSKLDDVAVAIRELTDEQRENRRLQVQILEAIKESNQ